MLELHDSREFILEYCAVMYNKAEKEMIYRVYVTEAFRQIAGFGELHYFDLIQKHDEVEDDRDPEEIKQSLKNRLNSMG